MSTYLVLICDECDNLIEEFSYKQWKKNNSIIYCSCGAMMKGPATETVDSCSCSWCGDWKHEVDNLRERKKGLLLEKEKAAIQLSFDGLSPDAPIETNAQGGRQSKIGYRFDLIDPKALFALARVLKDGADRYEPDNWRKIPKKDHLNHAMMHITAEFDGDTQDDHLEHAFTRLMMALGVKYEDIQR